MAHASSWKNPSTHVTYVRGNKITVTGYIYYSADGTSGTHGYYTNYTCYFYSYYTASWTVNAPICIGNSAGTAWAYIKPESIKSGGTPEKYGITYNGNGGIYQGITNNPWTEYKQYNVKYSIHTNWYTRTGYTFKNWNTKADGTGTAYAPGASYTTNKAMTLYAQWTRLAWSVFYDANGGTGAPAEQLKYYGTSLKLSEKIPTRTGYKFKNWNTKKDGTGTAYAPGASYTVNDVLQLYAQWEAVEYIISYDANGGTGAPESQKKKHGEFLWLSKVIPTRPGYKFTKWNTKADGTGTFYSAGAGYIKNADGTLYAQWEVDNILCVRTPDDWEYGIVYVKVDENTWELGEHAYVKVEENKDWQMSVR